MSEYLLPCSCGQRLPVSVAHAGQAVRCTSCGSELEVPTLRGLRALERGAAAPTAAARRRWGDRERIAFVLAVAAVIAALVGGVLVLRTPADPVPPMFQITSETPIAQVYAVYQSFLLEGLESNARSLTLPEREQLRHRELFQWGQRVAFGTAGAGLLASVGVLLFAKAQKR